MNNFFKETKLKTVLFTFFSSLILVYIGYFLVRESFFLLLVSYLFLFGFYWYSIQNSNKHSFKIGLLFRLILFLALPFLSQDYFRFIWDGRLLANGINPFQFLPDDLWRNSNFIIGQKEILYTGMGELSSGNYSNYPPLNQLIFWLAGILVPQSILGAVIVFRIIIIAADLGIFYFSKMILRTLNQNPEKANLYFLNPLIIIELTGNLHFEGVMIFLLCISIYYLLKNKIVLSSLFYSASILMKVFPIILLGLFIKRFKIVKLLKFYLIIGLIILLGFLPFLNSDLIRNYSSSIGLWLNKFEFNASIYYILREIGFYISGYNQIAILGKLSIIITSIFILWNIFYMKNIDNQKFITTLLFCSCIFFMSSTTVHPWYICTLVFFSIFTNYKFPILWSITVILSYYAYSQIIFHESYFILLLEYLPVFGLLFWEISENRKVSQS